jgi:hypothetical protein
MRPPQGAHQRHLTRRQDPAAPNFVDHRSTLPIGAYRKASGSWILDGGLELRVGGDFVNEVREFVP